MRNSVRSWALLAVFAAAAMRAQTAPDTPAAASPPNPAPAPDPAPLPHRVRAISPEMAAALAAAAPKFAPPPKPVEKKPDEELPDLRDVDKPKNAIVRLPKFVVREARPPIFTERDVNSDKGLGALAVRRYLSETDQVLNHFHLPLIGQTSEQRALMMYGEDERLKKMGDMSDLSNMVEKSDPSSGSSVRREVDKAFARQPDFGWPGGSPK